MRKKLKLNWYVTGLLILRALLKKASKAVDHTTDTVIELMSTIYSEHLELLDHSITLKPSTTTPVFNHTAFKKDYPYLYDQYMQKRNRASYLTIRLLDSRKKRK